MRGAAMVLMLVTLPEAQVKRDANECLAQSLNAGEMNRPGLVRVDRAAYRACMEQRGYAVRTTTE
jgi:hypothetical protein